LFSTIAAFLSKSVVNFDIGNAEIPCDTSLLGICEEGTEIQAQLVIYYYCITVLSWRTAKLLAAVGDSGFSKLKFTTKRDFCYCSEDNEYIELQAKKAPFPQSGEGASRYHFNFTTRFFDGSSRLIGEAILC